MKKIKVVILLVFFITLVGCKAKPDAVDSQDRKIYLADYQGKWLVVNYWATWCKPCLKELPELNSLYTNHSNQLMVFGVSFDDLSNQAIQAFAEKLAVNFPMLRIFPIGKYGVSDISALPVTFLISPQGKLVKTLHGPQTQESILSNLKENVTAQPQEGNLH